MERTGLKRPSIRAAWPPSFFASGMWWNSSPQLPDTYFFRPFFLVYLFLNFRAWSAHPVGYHVDIPERGCLDHEI